LDTGTHDALQDAASYVKTIQDRQDLKIACIEEIAWRMGFITKEQMLRAAKKVRKSTYGEYIFDIARREDGLR
jgi:glucose-1-phosphate thymidylyltransferase